MAAIGESGGSPNTVPSVSIDMGEQEPMIADTNSPTIVPKKRSWLQKGGVPIKWDSLTVRIEDKIVLDNVSGKCKPGQIIGVMGPSGSGKTTLLNALSGRVECEGLVSIGGRALSRKIRHLVGYSLQQDVFHPSLTLGRMLETTADLRLPQSADKKEAVSSVVEMLELSKCLNTKIGDENQRGLSGGEKKRASIACELLTDPPVLVLDEPTSGLDAHSAHGLMKSLKTLAQNQGKSIILSLHQPSSRIFHLLDKVLLLAGGKPAYFGPSELVVKYLANLKLVMETHYNPADYLLEVIHEKAERLTSVFRPITADTFIADCSSDATSKPEEGDKRKKEEQPSEAMSSRGDQFDDGLPDIQNTSNDSDSGRESCSSNASDINEATYSVPFDGQCDMRLLDNSEDRWPATYYTQIKVLTIRCLIVYLPIIASKINLIQTLCLAVVAGTLWFQAPRTEGNIKDIEGFMFFSTFYWMMHSHFQALNTFPREKTVLMKERESGWYRISAYYFAKTISELPLMLTLPVIYFIIAYLMYGVSNFGLMVGLMAIVILNSLVAQSFGLLVSVSIDNIEHCWAISAIMTVFQQLFGGYLSASVPPGMEWAKYGSMVYYAYTIMCTMELEYGSDITCSSKNSLYPTCQASSPNSTTVIPKDELLGFSPTTSTALPIWMNILALIGFLTLARVLTYLVLRFRYRPKY